MKKWSGQNQRIFKMKFFWPPCICNFVTEIMNGNWGKESRKLKEGIYIRTRWEFYQPIKNVPRIRWGNIFQFCSIVNENFKAALVRATLWILGSRSFNQRAHPWCLFPDGTHSPSGHNITRTVKLSAYPLRVFRITLNSSSFCFATE